MPSNNEKMSADGTPTGVPSATSPAGKPGRSRPVVVEAVSLDAGYGPIAVLRNVNLRVHEGEVVALVGANGAGKSTTLRALSGSITPTRGHVNMYGRETRDPLHRRARAGLRYITEQRSVFMNLSVMDNLKLGGKSIEIPLSLFPELRPLLKRKVGLLSGGEQQMLTLGRALAPPATVLLADELSLGLAPLVVRRLLDAVRTGAANGLSVLLVEQQIKSAFEVADWVYVMQRGQVVLEGAAADLKSRIGEIEASYLGVREESS
jgi:branched-chain amino acid transport system ATP-binding protein